MFNFIFEKIKFSNNDAGRVDIIPKIKANIRYLIGSLLYLSLKYINKIKNKAGKIANIIGSINIMFMQK